MMVLLAGFIIIAAPARAQEGCRVTASGGGVNLRAGPGVEWFGVVGVLEANQSLPVVGLNRAGDWYAVSFGGEGDIAWVAAHVVTAQGACAGLPVVDAPPPPGEIDRLTSMPALPDIDAEALKALKEVFARGQALGNDPHAFIKVGDCNTDSPFFLAGFDLDYYDLGPYGDLQPTLDYFAGWFVHESLTGQVGYNAYTVLDPLWADPELCNAQAGESPLACEYRRARPSIAVMMFGPNDMINLSAEQFAEALAGIVELSLDSGVIPVLTTFTWHRDARWREALEFNAITVQVAGEYGVPLINFWRAAQNLPNYGLIAGYTHLTDSGPHTKIVFNGEEKQYGHPLRNLLTLQVLDLLRREVLTQAP
ncbi:MAG: hypothetical protein JXB47_09425 [Anaerolineae bacterium]|nr:hypothetical protein [Anaerolineae bacterium]